MTGRFLTALDVEKPIWDESSDGRGTWVLTKQLEYLSGILGKTLVVPAGFVTDFASVPRIPVAFLLMGNEVHEAAVVHDYLYTTHEVDRATADKVFEEACIACGSYAWKAKLFWLGVRLGGEGPYERDGQVQPPRVQATIEAG